MTTTASPRPLDGVVVVDFSTLLPGPLATLMLAEAGARVIKIERPGGEDMRHHGPTIGSGGAAVSAYWAMLNRGKEVVTIDLKAADAFDRLAPLLARADVVVEQFRPGVMDRLGFGFERLSTLNPRLVHCSVTGFGQRGPKADLAGHDLGYQAATGALTIGRLPKVDPPLPGLLAADIAGGAFPAVIDILLGLLLREKTGRGARIDVAMCDALFTFAFFAQAEGAATGRFPDPGEPIFVGSLPRYSLYATRDERLLAVGALEEKFWQGFCDLIDLPGDLRRDGETVEATRAAVAERVAAWTLAEWKTRLAGADLCVEPVASLAEALGDPHFVARGLFDHRVATPSGEEIPACVVPIAPQFRGPAGARPTPALAGSDLDAIVASLSAV